MLFHPLMSIIQNKIRITSKKIFFVIKILTHYLSTNEKTFRFI